MTAPLISFTEFLLTPELSGPEWQKVTRSPWIALAKVIDGAELGRAELRLFRACTGLRRIPKGRRALLRFLQLLIGRRGGKSHFLAAFAVWLARFAADWRALLSPGERAVVLLLAVDRRQAAILARYAGAIVGAWGDPGVRVTADEIEFLDTGAVIEVGTTDSRSVRGRTFVGLVLDEAAFSDEEGLTGAEEVVAAVEPGMATLGHVGGGWIVLSSSPWRPRGLLHKRWTELHGQQEAADQAGALCWVASSTTMNPSLDRRWVERKVAEDPIKNRAEYIVDPASPWRSTDADFIPVDAIETATDWQVRERAPEPGRRYWAFLDAAGGSGTDSACLAIASADAAGEARLDAVRERRPRFVPAQALADFATTMREYGVFEVYADAWAAGLVRDELARHGVTFRPAKRSKSEIYVEALPLLLNGRARLLDDRRLRAQLGSLQRIARAGGREFVDGEKGKPEDLANAACGALTLAARRSLTSSAPIVGLYGAFAERGQPVSQLSGIYQYG